MCGLFCLSVGMEVGEDRHVVRPSGHLDSGWWHSKWQLGSTELFNLEIASFRCAPIVEPRFTTTGYLNDVAQPMMDEMSPDWAWPMKLRCLCNLRVRGYRCRVQGVQVCTVGPVGCLIARCWHFCVICLGADWGLVDGYISFA